MSNNVIKLSDRRPRAKPDGSVSIQIDLYKVGTLNETMDIGYQTIGGSERIGVKDLRDLEDLLQRLFLSWVAQKNREREADQVDGGDK